MTHAPRPTLTGLPVLDTERLTLRGPQAADWPAFRDYRASPRTVYTGGTKTAPQAAEQFASFFGHWVMRGFGRLIAEDRTTRQPIGHFGPMLWEDDAEVELTWSLWSAGAEGKGLATEAATAMHAWVFGPLGLTTARAEVHRDNAASHAIAQRLGGKVAQDERPKWMTDGAVYRFDGQFGGVAT
jgi:[ribosomal protein S5]-alanine N-acetyltransferase